MGQPRQAESSQIGVGKSECQPSSTPGSDPLSQSFPSTRTQPTWDVRAASV